MAMKKKATPTGEELVEHIRCVNAASGYREAVEETEAFFEKIYADRSSRVLSGSIESEPPPVHELPVLNSIIVDPDTPVWSGSILVTELGSEK